MMEQIWPSDQQTTELCEWCELWVVRVVVEEEEAGPLEWLQHKSAEHSSNNLGD